ncbi:hypothetical protein V6N11_030874 [Hibiscus sabdariffa]|uniref:Uncharacterized protein n=2 Tax=Hibiscus sabdariffa TaxID=183260 RepID=A0ABR2C1G3_9ROSI
MIEHSKKEAIHVYVEHKVEIPQYVEYEPSDVIDKNCESHVGQGGIGGPGGNVVGEVSNVGGSQELNFHLTLCDVNLGETKFKTSFEGEEAIVEGERLTTFEGPKTTFQGEKSTNFEGVEIASKGEDTSNFQAAKTNFESERSSGFKVEPTEGFLGEIEGVLKVQTERTTNIETDFRFDTEDSSETKGLRFIFPRKDGYGSENNDEIRKI